MKTRPYLVHALSPLHCGTGQAADVVDLPIARMRSTGIPIVPGSSVKGVLRDARRPPRGESPEAIRAYHEWTATFGPETSRAEEHAGALLVGDARLLALPVRSFRGTFAWVSSPLLLELARRDLPTGTGAPAVPRTLAPLAGARVGKLPPADQDKPNSDVTASLNVASGTRNRVLLEDLDLDVAADDAVAAWGQWLAGYVEPVPGALQFTRRWLVVDDETMTFLWDTALQIDTRVRLSETTRTVAKGALWVEESLPPETLLVGLLAAERDRSAAKLDPERVLDVALEGEAALQFGGKATIGRGRCRMVPLAKGSVPV